MSINQLVAPVYKKWLDAKVGGVTVDGEFVYDAANMVSGDILMLDSNKIAQWTPLSNLTVGSVLLARIQAVNLNSTVVTLNISSIIPFPTTYTIGSNFVTVNETGQYLVSALLYAGVSVGQMAVEIAVNGVANTSSENVSVLSPKLSYIESNTYTQIPLKLNAGDVVTFLANSITGATMSVLSSGSILSILRLN